MKTENELIAEFMGETDDVIGPGGPYEYHLFWDRLMPVVEKIETIPLPVGWKIRMSIGNNGNGQSHCFIYKHEPGMSVGKQVAARHSDSKIEAVYNAVVEFIKWYNKPNDSGK